MRTNYLTALFILLIFQLTCVFSFRKLKGTDMVPFRYEPNKIRGDPSAPISLVVFSDFQCPFCRVIHDQLLKIIDKYPHVVRIVYKQYPLDFMNSQSKIVAEASECAADQGRFLDYHDTLFENVGHWEYSQNITQILEFYAKDLGLNSDIFNSCLESGNKKPVVQNNKDEGKRMLVTGTPTVLINGKRILTKNKFEYIDLAIQKELSRLNSTDHENQ